MIFFRLKNCLFPCISRQRPAAFPRRRACRLFSARAFRFPAKRRSSAPFFQSCISILHSFYPPFLYVHPVSPAGTHRNSSAFYTKHQKIHPSFFICAPPYSPAFFQVRRQQKVPPFSPLLFRQGGKEGEKRGGLFAACAHGKMQGFRVVHK